jgi:hypothetical protein
MTIVEFSRRIELHFWDWVIPNLSASPVLQMGVRYAYRFMRKTAPFRKYFIGTGLAILGFTNGMFVYWLVAR